MNYRGKCSHYFLILQIFDVVFWLKEIVIRLFFILII